MLHCGHMWACRIPLTQTPLAQTVVYPVLVALASSPPQFLRVRPVVSSNNQVGGEKQGMEQSQVRHGAPALLWLAVRPQMPVWIQVQVRLG